MKKLLVGAALSLAATGAWADATFSLSGSSGTANLASNAFFSATAAQLGLASLPTVNIANLSVVGGPAQVTYTWLGSEAGFFDKAFAGNTSPASTLLFTTLGTSGAFAPCASGCVSSAFSVGNGILPFQFLSPLGAAINGSNTLAEPDFGVFLTADLKTAYLFFNDNGSGPDKDFDDMIIKATLNVAAVPEPSTYAMLLAGLGVMGAVIRRRRT